DLPPPWRINPFIIRGYRFTASLVATALSSMCFSNELVNIWTHLIPVVLVLRYPLGSLPPFETFRDGGLHKDLDAVIAIGYFAAAVVSLLCSSAWHTFRCCAQLQVMSAFVSVDIMSVSLILTSFNILMIHTAFYSQPIIRAEYILSSLTWCAAGLFLPWTNFFRPVQVAPIKLVIVAKWPLSRAWTRVLFFCALGTQGVILPAIHAALLNRWSYTSEIYTLAGRVVAPIFLGSIINASKFPERRWPGKFDFFGNSHNIWHVATAISALQDCEVMQRMFELAWRSQR
ncbi:hemolysin-III related-domain-containing protein, partial [Coniochaeta sp. 2T2.1]